MRIQLLILIIIKIQVSQRVVEAVAAAKIPQILIQQVPLIIRQVLKAAPQRKVIARLIVLAAVIVAPLQLIVAPIIKTVEAPPIVKVQAVRVLRAVYLNSYHHLTSQ